MPTAATPRGKTANLLFGTQADFATIAAGNYTRTLFYSESLAEASPFETDPILGLPRDNNRDATRPADGLASLSGDLVVPVDVNHFPYWLTALFGAADTTGAGPYVHTFTSGKEVLPYLTIEVEKRAGAAFFQSLGCLASALNLDWTRAAGFRQATVAILGRNQVKSGASVGGTPPAILDRAPLSAAQGLLRINGVTAAHVLGGSLAYANNPEEDQSLNGTPYASGMLLDQDATATGAIRLRYVDETYYDLMLAGNPVAMELEFSSGAGAKVVFAMPAVRFEKGGFAPVSGPGGLQAELNWRAEQTDAAPMLTVTVTNGVVSYA